MTFSLMLNSFINLFGKFPDDDDCYIYSFYRTSSHVKKTCRPTIISVGVIHPRVNFFSSFFVLCTV